MSGEFRLTRKRLIFLIALSALVALGLWLGLYFLLPPLEGMSEPVSRLGFALKCICISSLLCFVTGIEAVAHERLQSPAIDPLNSYETRRMRINLRYLQHTLEQFVVFAPALCALSWYCADGFSMRAVVASTVVWIVERYAFWIGYHFGSEYRAFGAPGMALGMLLLIYVSSRFAYELMGAGGVILVLGIFAFVEVFLFRVTGRPTNKFTIRD